MDQSILLKSLRFCKGITKNSMFSIIIPSYDYITKTIENINSLIKMAEGMSYDEDDCKYMLKVYNETINFIKGIKFQDEDKECLGLIVYYGYIDDPIDIEGKKVFHTFPFEKNTIEEEIYIGERFNLGYLNKNKWFRESFDEVK